MFLKAMYFNEVKPRGTAVLEQLTCNPSFSDVIKMFYLIRKAILMPSAFQIPEPFVRQSYGYIERAVLKVKTCTLRGLKLLLGQKGVIKSSVFL